MKELIEKYWDNVQHVEEVAREFDIAVGSLLRANLFDIFELLICPIEAIQQDEDGDIEDHGNVPNAVSSTSGDDSSTSSLVDSEMDLVL